MTYGKRDGMLHTDFADASMRDKIRLNRIGGCDFRISE